MEGDLDSDAERRPPPAVGNSTGSSHHLTRSNSDAWSLTAGNCKDFFHLSENVTPNECTAWTNEKHNSYIYHLEMSFVKQLYQSKSILAHCTGNNLRDIHISQKQLINVHNAYEQNGCWQKINCAVEDPISVSTSANSHASIETKRTRNSKHSDMNFHPSPNKTPALVKLISAWKQGKEVISHGIQTCPQEFLSSKLTNGDLVDLNEEGMGQNFLDDNNQSALNFESRAKRLKIALGDGLHHDQIASSRKYPTSNSVINNSTCEEQLACCEPVSKF